MNIAVFGLGYVGVVNIACLSKLGHKIYGCDVKPHKAELINKGKGTILEPQIDELLLKGNTSGLVIGSTDANYCIENTEMALICVGTPSDASGNVNLNYIINTAREIGASIKKIDKKYTLVFRSTIPPGTVEETIIPELKELLGDKFKNVNIVFLPEFLREGSAVKDFFHGARIVIGLDEGLNGKEEIEKVFNFSEDSILVFTNYRTAEFVKYVDNAYHAAKVTFANEVYSIGSALGVDIKQANNIFLMDNVLNISGRYLKPGTPFGGSCLPKDTRAIIHLAEKIHVEIPFFKGLVASNHEHQKRLLQKVLEFKKKKILIYGLTFKQNTDDIRESPFLLLLKSLIDNQKDVKVVDPNLNIMSLRVEFPEIVKYINNNLEDSLKWADLIVLNKRDIKTIIELCDNVKPIVNCIDNENYSHLTSNVYNLF
jgi:GDP-mannose 6-dehydrogenase